MKTKKRLALIGSKDFAHQIVRAALLTGEFDIIGFFDDYENPGTIVDGAPILGKTCEIVNLYQADCFDCIFIAIGYEHFAARQRFYEMLKGVIPLATIISPSAYVASSAIIGEGCYIGGRNQINAECVVEDNAVMMGNVVLGHNNVIGKHSYLAGGIYMAGFTSIGERCFVGIGATISDKITIVDDVWIGLGMIVYKSIRKPGKYSVYQRIIKLE